MKKKVSLREFVMLALLIVIVVYYFALHVPVNSQMAEIETQQADVESEIDTATATLMTKKTMEKELDRIFEAAGGNPPELAEYNNANQVIMELNAILDSAETYNINFSAENTESYIVRREIDLNFQADDYDSAKDIITDIHDSGLRYLIEDVSLTEGTNKDEGTYYQGSISIVCFEYKAQ